MKVWGLIPQMGTHQSAPISLRRDPEAYPLVPRWLLIIADIPLFVLLCFLIHRVSSPVVSWVAVEPSGTGLPSTLGSRGSIGAEPPSRASASGAPKYIASREYLYIHHTRVRVSPNHQNS